MPQCFYQESKHYSRVPLGAPVFTGFANLSFVDLSVYKASFQARACVVIRYVLCVCVAMLSDFLNNPTPSVFFCYLLPPFALPFFKLNEKTDSESELHLPPYMRSTGILPIV